MAAVTICSDFGAHTQKKSEIMPFAATCIDLEIVILRKESQTEKEEYHMASFICGNLKRHDANELIKQNETHRLRK